MLATGIGALIVHRSRLQAGRATQPTTFIDQKTNIPYNAFLHQHEHNMYQGTLFQHDDLHELMEAYQKVMALKQCKKLITEEEFTAIYQTYKFNLLAGFADHITNRADLELILNATDDLLERLEEAFPLIYPGLILKKTSVTLHDLAAMSITDLKKVKAKATSIIRIKTEFLQEDSLLSILDIVPSAGFKFLDRFNSEVQTEKDFDAVCDITLEQLEQYEWCYPLRGHYGITTRDLLALNRVQAEAFGDVARFFHNYALIRDTDKTLLKKEDIFSLNLAQLDSLKWFITHIGRPGLGSHSYVPQCINKTTFSLLINLDETAKNKLINAERLGLTEHMTVEQILSMTHEQLQFLEEQVEPFFKHVLGDECLGQKIGEHLILRPGVIDSLEEQAYALWDEERNSFTINQEKRQNLQTRINEAFKKVISDNELIQYPDSLKALIEHGTIKIDWSNSSHFGNLLYLAAKNNQIASLNLLLSQEHNAAPGYKSILSQALRTASREGHFDCVRTLVEHGTSLNECCNVRIEETDNGLMPIHIAIIGGYYDIAQYLWDKVSDTPRTDRGETPMHLAAKKGAHQLLGHMLATGGEVDCRDDQYNTPLAEAITNIQESLATIKVLLDAGANPNAITKGSATPYQNIKWIYAAYQEQVRTLVQQKSQWPIKSLPNFGAIESEHSDFFLAAYKGDIAKFEHLLKRQSINYQSHNGYTALHCAVLGGQTEMARYLLDKGIDKRVRGMHNNTALQLAVRENLEQIVELIAAKTPVEELPDPRNSYSPFFFKSPDTRAIIDKYKYPESILNYH